MAYENTEADRLPMSQWLKAHDRLIVPKRSNIEPKIDELVSKAIGTKVYMHDPRLIKLIVKWKKQSAKSDDSSQPDNYLEDPSKLEELKETFLK